MEEIVKDHLMYLDAVQEFTDWLHSAKEELHRWSDMSEDSSAAQKKLSKIKVRKWTSVIVHCFMRQQTEYDKNLVAKFLLFVTFPS